MIAEAVFAKGEVSNGYNEALTMVQTALDGLVAQKCDPIKVPTESGNVNLRKIYENLEASKSATLAEIDNSLAGVAS